MKKQKVVSIGVRGHLTLSDVSKLSQLTGVEVGVGKGKNTLRVVTPEGEVVVTFWHETTPDSTPPGVKPS